MKIDQTIVKIEHGQRIGVFSDIHGNDTSLWLMFKKHSDNKTLVLSWRCHRPMGCRAQ